MRVIDAIAAITAGTVAAISVSATTSDAQTSATLFHQVRVFDGVRDIGVRDVLVANGKIAAVADHVPAPAGATVVEGRGETLLPGLIDSHTHTWGDALQQALVFGVTTELDMFTDPRFAAAMRAEQRAGSVPARADLYSAGFLATVPRGHGTEYGIPVPTITSPDSAQAWVAARIAEGSDYIKIIIDNGSTYGISIPTLSTPTVAAIVRAAHARGKLAVAHIGSLADAHEAIDAGVDGLEHLFVDREPEPGFGRYVAAHHVFVVPTLTVLSSITSSSGVSALASDSRLSPYLAESSRGTIASAFPIRRTVTTHYGAAVNAVKQLKAAGVPILAGTDAPNPGTAHGIALHRELELLVQAGLTPTEALAAATSTPARLFSLSDRGTIAPGKRADLLLVNGDPMIDITATRSISGVWKDGQKYYRTPASRPAAAPSGASAPGMISDFEDGTTRTSIGMGWVVTTDRMAGGSSSATMSVVDGGANGTSKSLESAGDVVAPLPYAWAGVMFMPGAQAMQPVNLSAAKAIHFWARGDGRTYHVMVFAASRGQMPLTVDFVAAPEWKEYVFPFSSFSGIDGHDVMGIAFTAGPDAGAFRFRIDEVSLQ